MSDPSVYVRDDLAESSGMACAASIELEVAECSTIRLMASLTSARERDPIPAPIGGKEPRIFLPD